MKHVVNAIPDNWPMALHLAEGSLHTVQTRSAYLGYRTLNGMQGDEVLKPMPGDSIRYVGHYIDHELVAAIEEDCDRRIERRKRKAPMRFLLTIGGARSAEGYICSYYQDGACQREEGQHGSVRESRRLYERMGRAGERDTSYGEPCHYTFR